jgi:hypothetical protein
MQQKIYLSTNFYTVHPFGKCTPEIELRALQYLLGRLLEQEKYEVAALVKERIHKVKQQLITNKTWCVLKEINYCLN